MVSKFIGKINLYCALLENRYNLLVSSLVIAAIILCFDMLYITPNFEAAYHGLQYAKLSNNPFDLSETNALRYRILPSFIGYLFYLRGNLFFIVPLLFAFVFISSVYYNYRKKNYQPIDALLFTGLIAFSCTIFIQLQAAGYTDAVFYYFLFMAFSFVKKPFISSLFFGMAMLTHESSAFLFPGLLLYSKYVNDNTVFEKTVIYLLLSFIPFLVYRYWVSSYIEVEYDLSFYFSKSNILFSLKKVLPYFSIGSFYAFKFFWFFPIYILYKSWQRKEYQFFTIILIILFCVFAQLVIAFDTTRLACLAFPAILISAERMKELWDPYKFTRFVLLLIIVNFLLLPYFMSADALIPMLPLPYTLFLGWFG